MSHTQQIRARLRAIDDARDSLERELLYCWQQVETAKDTYSYMSVDDWLGIAHDTEEALQFVYIARSAALASLVDVLLPIPQA